MNLNEINAASSIKQKSIIKLQDLPIDIPVPICAIKIVETKYGRSALTELEDHIVFLPKRSLVFIEANLDNFKPKKYGIIFKGLVDCQRSRPAVNFEIVELHQSEQPSSA